MMDSQKLLRSALPVRLMSTGCWSASLDDSISDGKEHVQSSPCHPVQEVLGWTAAHVEDGHHGELAAAVRNDPRWIGQSNSHHRRQVEVTAPETPQPCHSEQR